MENNSSTGSLIAIGAVVAIVLGLVMAIMGNPRAQNAVNYLTNGSGQPSTGSSIVGGPSLSAQKIDTILANANSPAKGSGQALHDLSAEYNVDDAFALAVFRRESSYGTSGEATKTLSLGNLRCIPNTACVDGYAAFPDWQTGYTAFYRLIAGPLYVGRGLTTPDQIMPVYAPATDNNNPTSYATAVNADMALWKQP